MQPLPTVDTAQQIARSGRPDLGASGPEAADPETTDLDDPHLEALVRHHQVAVWRYLRLLGASPSLADDLTQDAFLVAFRHDWRERSAAEAAAFLRGTARHLWLRHHRDSRRRAELVAEAAEQVWRRDFSDDAGERWLDALRGCLAGLGERARRCVDGFYRDGMSRRRIAASLGMKENGVKGLLQRTRQALRDCVQRRLER